MRNTGWTESYVQFIESRRSTPFGWGAHDCCLFAADSGLVVCGIDFAELVRGYTSEEEARDIIAGYGGMEAMVSTLMDREPIAAALARRADFVKARLAGGETMGICMGARCAFARLDGGVVILPTSVAQIAWRVE